MISHHIIINTGDAAPEKARPYRLARLKNKMVKEEILNMHSADVIQPSPFAWSSAPVLVPKPDGYVRFCTDYRGLNAVSARDNYPMPRVDHTLEALGTKNVGYMPKLYFK
jgi:hypothetical protein